MPRRRPHRHPAAWIALVALLLSALWPARALPVEETYSLLGLDICAARHVGQRDGTDPVGAHHTRGDHCPACWLGHAVALPPSLQTRAPTLALSHEAPALFYLAPHPLHAWVTAHARAPPAPV